MTKVNTPTCWTRSVFHSLGCQCLGWKKGPNRLRVKSVAGSSQLVVWSLCAAATAESLLPWPVHKGSISKDLSLTGKCIYSCPDELLEGMFFSERSMINLCCAGEELCVFCALLARHLWTMVQKKWWCSRIWILPSESVSLQGWMMKCTNSAHRLCWDAPNLTSAATWHTAGTQLSTRKSKWSCQAKLRNLEMSMNLKVLTQQLLFSLCYLWTEAWGMFRYYRPVEVSWVTGVAVQESPLQLIWCWAVSSCLVW